MSDIQKLTKEELAIFQTDIPAIYKVENYVVNVAKNQVDFMQWCKFVIQQALDCKGDNKTDKAGETTMAIGFAKAILLDYSHISLDLIEQTLIRNHFGEGYVASWGSLIETLQKEGLNRQSVENKLKELEKVRKQEEQERQQRLHKLREQQNTPQAKRKRVKQIYIDWIEKGKLDDYNNEVFSWIIKKELYHWSEEERAKAKSIARTKTREVYVKMKARAGMDFDKIKRINTIINSTLEEEELFDKFNKEQLTTIYFQSIKAEKEQNNDV
ncbi:MAG TPA: hypothetical protein VJ083_01445 [Sedimentibacter sp.]|nr:hypothetical protein [Sedimentibacter sp.]